MSAFTDEDLKRLNEYSYGHEIHMLDGGTFDLKALLARLEAAEHFIIMHFEKDDFWYGCAELQAWRKASGRDKPAPICLNDCKGRCDNPTHDPFAY